MNLQPQKHKCNGIERTSVIAPMPMSVFLPRDLEKIRQMADELNIERFSLSEREDMAIGRMAVRHMVYEDYCVNQTFTYESK